MTHDTKTSPAWELNDDHLSDDQEGNFIAFIPDDIPVIQYHFGFNPTLAAKNGEGLTLADCDHIEVMVQLAEEDQSIIIDEIRVTQMFVGKGNNELGLPSNLGVLRQGKVGKIKLAYRNWEPSRDERLSRLLEKAALVISVQQDDIRSYRSGVKS